MSCTIERHIFYGSGSSSSDPLMNERCACGVLKQGDISPLERLKAENKRLRAAVDAVRAEKEAEIERLRQALRTARGYAAEIDADAITSLQSLRASLIQEAADRALGDYPPSESPT